MLSFTCVRNEGPFLLEWIAYHRLIGITDFIFFTNNCDDGSESLLSKLAQHGVVRHIDQTVQNDVSVQWQALKRVTEERLTHSYDWAMFTDVDEFPMIHVGEHRFIDALSVLPERVDALAMPWRLFGANGCYTFDDMPVTEKFTRSAPPNLYHPIAGRYFKTLFRPSRFQKCGVHRPKRKPSQPLPLWCDGSGRPLTDAFSEREGQIALSTLEVGRNIIELNHYSLRSAASFIVKASRGLANRRVKLIDLSYWVERNFNTVENSAISVWSAALSAEINSLRALPGIEDLHQQACDWHSNRFAELLRTHEGYRLYCDCLHAHESAVFSRDLALELYAAFGDLPK